MEIHVKTKWHKAENKSIEDIASVLALTTWKVGVRAVDHIGDENFQFTTIQNRFAVLEEILIFLIQIMDRWSHERMDDGERERLVTDVVMQLAATIDENQNDWIGVGNYRSAFFARFNERGQEYANFSFSQDEPGYQFRRYLGERVLAVMGEENGNRWVIDQVMEIEIPDAIKTLRRSFQGLILDSTTRGHSTRATLD
ncbi:conserved hypothetical protein [Gammaproteobacteria bacterium]